MTWTFAVSGSPASCVKQLGDNLDQATRAEKAVADAEGIDAYFQSIRERLTPLLQNAPEDSHVTASLSGDAHSGLFSCSFNQPANRA